MHAYLVVKLADSLSGTELVHLLLVQQILNLAQKSAKKKCVGVRHPTKGRSGNAINNFL